MKPIDGCMVMDLQMSRSCEMAKDKAHVHRFLLFGVVGGVGVSIWFGFKNDQGG